ncbi:pyocin knob domain-containing protein [Megamonas funiformis]|uniref:pyocin knob domain-containing protein n=1 Tax=Megamonas funiformis TaxID=437897 RepID=UPI003F9C794C
MNSEELKKEFGLLMPSEINGFKRPDESIPSSNDFFLEIPQLISKDPVLYSTMNLIFSVILSNDKLLKQWIDTLQNVVNAQDWRVVTDSLKGYMTPELKKKLDGIANGANNYVHPSTHPASMITQDTTHRFVTDTEKTTWNGKASTAVVSTTANGLMPKRDGSATSIFTGDGVWKSLAWNLITGKPSTFPPSTHNHDSSYLKRDNNNKNDLNSCTVEGIYRFAGTLTGGWTGTSWGTLLVLNNQYNGGSGISGTWLVQLAFPTDNTIRMRQRVNTDAWSSWVTLARTSDNITSATKATQDSRGQQIDTTYVKGVTANNATLTITKGNGSTSTTTVNNVSRAEYSDRVGVNAGYTGSTTGSSLKGGLSQATIYDNSFPFPYGNLISVKNAGANQIALEWSGTTGAIGRVAVRNARDATLETWSAWRYLAYTESPAFSGSPTAPTQGTSDNSTKIATTAFVRNLINQFKNDGTLGGIVGGSLTQNGWVKFSNGLILQWGYYAQANNTYNFPITFPNKCFNVILQYTDSANEICLAVISLSDKQFKSVCKGYNGVYRNSPIYMFSIGF